MHFEIPFNFRNTPSLLSAKSDNICANGLRLSHQRETSRVQINCIQCKLRSLDFLRINHEKPMNFYSRAAASLTELFVVVVVLLVGETFFQFLVLFIFLLGRQFSNLGNYQPRSGRSADDAFVH